MILSFLISINMSSKATVGFSKNVFFQKLIEQSKNKNNKIKETTTKTDVNHKILPIKPAIIPTIKPAIKPIIKPAIKPTIKPAIKPTIKPNNRVDKIDKTITKNDFLV